MDQVFEILIHKVNDFQGTINELRGDGILAFFGAPIALEDAPQRAIRSALAIHNEMIRFNEKIKKSKPILPVLLRITEVLAMKNYPLAPGWKLLARPKGVHKNSAVMVLSPGSAHLP